MKILACNVGSTSLKYRLYDFGKEILELAWGRFERIGHQDSTAFLEAAGQVKIELENLDLKDHKAAIECMLDDLRARVLEDIKEIAALSFKVVIAKNVTGVRLLNEEVLAAMASFNTLAPAHNPPYIAAIRQFKELLPAAKMIGSFETGFHSTMPDYAYHYSLPYDFAKAGIRRYGVHGASHEYVANFIAARCGQKHRAISCHLGGSSSLCAILDQESIDTTVGMSLQSGLMHNNRIGDLDPYMSFYLATELGMSTTEIQDLYTKKSGFLGLSNFYSNDLRDIEEGARAGNQACKLAIASFSYQLRKQIGAYAAALGGLDVIAFAGGIGENAANLRAQALAELGFLGIKLDSKLNQESKANSLISSPDSKVKVYIVATNEEIIIAQKAYDYLVKLA